MQGTRSFLAKKNYILAILLALFIMGMIYGALIVKSNSRQLLSMMSVFSQGYIGSNRTFLGTFTTTFVSNLVFIAIPYICGYSAVFQAFTVFVPLFKGLGLGLSMAYLYSGHGLQGLLYSLLIIVPQTIIALFSMFVACRESVRLSNLFLCSIKQNDCINIQIVKLYNVKFVVLTAIVLVSALINAISVFLFSGMFFIQ